MYAIAAGCQKVCQVMNVGSKTVPCNECYVCCLWNVSRMSHVMDEYFGISVGCIMLGMYILQYVSLMRHVMNIMYAAVCHF